MSYTLITGPASEPVTLAEAKAHLRIAISDDDGLLAGKILSARNHLEEITGRAFLTQTWDYTLDHDWPWLQDMETRIHTRMIEVMKAPLQSVTSITYVDSAGATQTLASSQYVVDSSSTIGRIFPAYGVAWPTVRCQRAAITVRFVAGWTDNFPDSLREALLMQIERDMDRDPSMKDALEDAISRKVAPFRVYY